MGFTIATHESTTSEDTQLRVLTYDSVHERLIVAGRWAQAEGEEPIESVQLFTAGSLATGTKFDLDSSVCQNGADPSPAVYDVEVDNQGRTWLAGTRCDQMWVSRYDEGSSMEFSHLFDKDANGIETANALTIDEDGRVALCGTTDTGLSHQDPWVVLLDAEGQLGWDRAVKKLKRTATGRLRPELGA